LGTGGAVGGAGTLTGGTGTVTVGTGTLTVGTGTLTVGTGLVAVGRLGSARAAETTWPAPSPPNMHAATSNIRPLA